jgi:hypothetical protein
MRLSRYRCAQHTEYMQAHIAEPPATLQQSTANLVQGRALGISLRRRGAGTTGLSVSGASSRKVTLGRVTLR